MTTVEVFQMVQAVDIPAAYHHFEEGSGQQPPFICFYYPGNDDLLADNVNYARINQLIIELYTDNKDFDLEAAVETVLRTNEMAYSKVETYIDTEKMYMVAYTMEVLIDG